AMTTNTQIFEIYIKATPEKIWEAITSPDWTARYGYQSRAEFDLRPGGVAIYHANDEMIQMGLPEVIIDGEVLECDPPNRLVTSYRWLFTEENKAEGFTRITWEIALTSAGFCKFTVTHDVTGAPIMAQSIRGTFSDQGGGGWTWILSDLKSLLETGAILAA
uniref:SRPBCC domain-containing protein n=1 Tax=Phenylobacterium sp. TaxID=1871053 RepID=UPI00286CCD58